MSWIDVKSFVYKNITPYEGDASFLVWPTEKTKRLWEVCKVALKKERDNILAELFKKLSNKGVYCMLTNHNTELIRELYRDYNIEVVPVHRNINSKGNSRKGEEVIITNYQYATN